MRRRFSRLCLITVLALTIVLAFTMAFCEQSSAQEKKQDGDATTTIVPTATPAEKIRVPDGFVAELLYSVPLAEQGSWVSLTADTKGRLITSDQYGKLFRITPAKFGDSASQTQIEPISLKIGMAQGLLCAFDSLYVVVNGNQEGLPGSGLYRLQDTDGDDQYDQVTTLRKFEGGGEHGPHAVLLSPDKQSLYICGGNHTKIPNPETSRVPRNWQEDQLLPSMPDAGGHAVNITAPGGWVAKTDPEGKAFELIATGFRNEYDIAFNSSGELFTYDADMEWDVGAPWYRPTRVCHVTSGAEFGWRTGTGKWPASYPDSLPATVDIGPGSPTGICFGSGAKFPTKYQQALFIADWSYGIIYAVQLNEDGATYRGTPERFCSAAALQVTDLAVNPVDGALYFNIGGRGTQSGLYRVTYTGDDSVDPLKAAEPGELIMLRRKIEQDHREIGAEAVDRNWLYLNHPDRFVRFAARIAIEHQPVDLWRERACSEPDANRAIQAIVALARNGSDRDHDPAIERLAKIDFDLLSEAQQIDLIRANGLVLMRLGIPLERSREAIRTKFAGHFPSGSPELNRELYRLLIAAEEPTVVSKGISLLQAAATQEEQIDLALCLRVAKDGWDRNSREAYFNWFLDAAKLQGGHSFGGFLSNIRSAAIENLTAEEKAELAGVLAKKAEVTDPYADLKALPFVREWTVDELLADVEGLDIASRDLENGRKMFSVSQCFKCHRFDGQGGIVGPDLTAAGRRFNSRGLLESLIEPSKVVSDQYQATVFEMDDGKTIVGRVANLAQNNFRVQEDMMRPGEFTNVDRNRLEDMYPSEISMMPEGLLNNLTKNQILDLIAYIRSATADEGDESGEHASTDASAKKKVVAEQSSAKREPDTGRPNVVLIISDDQAWNDYGFMGHKQIRTPRLDQLARESFTFTRGYVPTALCRPSLATIISGLYAHQHLISGNDPARTDASGNKVPQQEYARQREKLISQIDRVPTLPRLLGEHGYVSFQSGKWWEGNYRRGGFTHGMTRGFPEKGGRHGDDGLDIGREGMKPVLDFIDEAVDQQKPFFVWYAPFLPHTPHTPPQRILDHYAAKDVPIELAKYHAMCEWFDETCGTLLDHIDRRSVRENTIVVYVTDNGWIQRTPQTELPADWKSPFAPRSKQTAYEGGVRTPIMIRWPGRIQTKRDDRTLVSSIDIAPTILTACGLEALPEMQGQNLLEHCNGNSIARDQVFGEAYAHDVAGIDDPNLSLLATWIVRDKWKLLQHHPGRIGRYPAVHRFADQQELFNLAADPTEQKNLLGQNKDRATSLASEIERWRRAVKEPVR